MQHKKMHTIAVIIAVIVVVGGGWYVYSQTLGRPSLSGETTHDFGVVMLTGHETKVSHTFEVINDTENVIIINDIKSSCKCTIPELSEYRVLPGKPLPLTAELTVRNSGLLKSEISILLSDNRVHTLFVQAVGKRELPLTYIGKHIELLLNLPKILPIQCEVYDANDDPLPLLVRTPKGVTHSFKRWKFVKAYNEEWQNPAIFEAELILTRTTAEDLPLDATVDVSLDGENWYSVPINRPDLIEIINYDGDPQHRDPGP